MTLGTLILIVYVFCGIVDYGLNFAFWQKNCVPSAAQELASSHRYAALQSAVYGPVGLMSTLVTCGVRRGLRFW